MKLVFRATGYTETFVIEMLEKAFPGMPSGVFEGMLVEWPKNFDGSFKHISDENILNLMFGSPLAE